VQQPAGAQFFEEFFFKTQPSLLTAAAGWLSAEQFGIFLVSLLKQHQRK
jgi:hypothetical protein